MPSSGQKILFIGVGFYDYDRAICDTLSQIGYDVEYRNSSARMTVARKLLKKAGMNAINLRTFSRHADAEIASARTGNDVVFVIKGENISEKALRRLKNTNPHATFILYLWDNLKKISNRDYLTKYFDRILSFDRKDCAEHSEFIFRPLFYHRLPPESGICDYDISFIGEDRPGRYRLLRTIDRRLASTNGIRYYLRLKSSVLLTLLDRMRGSRLCSNARLPYSTFCDITNSSRAVLDIVETGQSGLTMRTIEALAMGKHLYTTNPDISVTPHISKDSYTVIDPVAPDIALGRTGGQEDDFFSYYSIGRFISDILNITAP